MITQVLEIFDFSRVYSGKFARLVCALGAALCATACGGEPPVAPSPPPVQPLALTCPAPVSALSGSTVGTSVNYAAPVAAGGQLPVAVTCAPLSGQLFAPGITTVNCTATDAVSTVARCAFAVTVTVPPRLTVTRFLAFGDSITAGEITAPMVTALGSDPPAYRQIVVPSASYPTVLDGLLDARYLVQTPTVINAGKPGEVTVDGLTRFGALLRSERPDVLLLLDGHNDLGSSAQAIEGYNALVSMVQQAKASGVRVYLGTLVPSIQGRLRSQPLGLLLQFNDAVRGLAAREGVTLVDLYAAMLPEVNTLIGADGLHPNEAGYVRIANLFFTAIRNSLEVR
jgi:lysophospholipase L1-like esterase